MLAKLGFFLIVAIFGVLMFAAGATAPESVRQPVASIARKAAAQTQPSLPAGQQQEGPAAAPAIPPPQKDEPISSEALLLPASLPEKGRYALQVGQFADSDEAAALARRIDALDLPSAQIPVVDRSGQRWSVVAAGDYASPEDGRAARAPVARKLGLGEALPVIMLPAKPAAASAGPAR